MAKSTQKQALLTEQRIHKAIIDIFSEKGWEAISYGSIAKHTGLSRGGVQRIIPNKEAMMADFKDHIIQIMHTQLDLSDKRVFENSWITALEKEQFRHSLKFLICAISTESPAQVISRQLFSDFSELVGEEKMQYLIGLSVYQLLDS